MYVYIIYIYTNLQGNAIVRLPHPWRGGSHEGELFLASSDDKQTHNYDLEWSSQHPSLTTLKSKGLSRSNMK